MIDRDITSGETKPWETPGPGPAITPPREPPLWRPVAAVAGLALVMVALSMGVTIHVLRPGREAPQAGRRPGPGAGGPAGSVSVLIPRAVPSSLLRVSLLRHGEPARTAGGELLDRMPAAALRAQPLNPALYVVRFTYRGKPLTDVTAQVLPGRATILQPSLRELAAVEYETGIRGLAPGDSDVDHFRRVLQPEASRPLAPKGPGPDGKGPGPDRSHRGQAGGHETETRISLDYRPPL